MDLERTIQEMPKPLLAAIVIGIAIVTFIVMEPPHTVCDSQRDNFKANQEGILFPSKQGKRTYEGAIQLAMEACRQGNSSGSCYDYFNILRRAAMSVKDGSSECFGPMLSVTIPKYARIENYETVRDPDQPTQTKEVLASVDYKDRSLKDVFVDGVEIMTLKAWGEEPPASVSNRLGWFQMSEMNVFCHLKDVLVRSSGGGQWSELRKRILPKLPGRPLPALLSGARSTNQGIAAVSMMSEKEVWDLSILSFNCEGIR